MFIIYMICIISVQCHKCRTINYDEKDPFLCNSCGFCKYAKFEYTLTSRPCCAVDPIGNLHKYVGAHQGYG